MRKKPIYQKINWTNPLLVLPFDFVFLNRANESDESYMLYRVGLDFQ